MACVTSPEVGLDTSPKHDVAPDTSQSPHMAWYTFQTPSLYNTAYTCVHVPSTSDIHYVAFREEYDESNVKYGILEERRLNQV